MGNSFAERKGKAGQFTYPSQIRLVVLLLLLFLVVLNLQVTYLFEQSKRGLSQELESRLKLAAVLFEPYWKEKERGSKDRQGTGKGREGDLSSLQAGLQRSGLDRILWIPQEGEPLVMEETGKGSWSGLAIPREWDGILRRAWKGEKVFSPVYRVPRGGYQKALLVPLSDREGKIMALMALVAPADSLGDLSRFSSIILYGFLIGIPAALVISLFFIDFVLSPYRRLSSATRSSSGEEVAPLDVDAIVAAYERNILALREKELELARLYQVEQKRASDLESYQRYLLNHMSSGVISLTPDFRIQVCNPVAREILGLLEVEVQGKDAREVFAQMPEFRSLLEETVQEGKIHQRRELQILQEGDERSWIGLSSSLLQDEGGALEGAIFLLVDLTEVRRLQEQMRIRENLAAMGEMSAGVAHEFRNSLSTLLGQIRLLQRRLPDDDGRKKTLQEMVGEILSLEGVIQEFLRFARPLEVKIQPLDLSGFLKEFAASFVEPLAEAHIQMVLGPCPRIWIQADPLALRQVLVNLIQNSKEAMPAGGRVEFTVRVPPERLGWQRARPASWEKGFVRISVSDTGRGMGEEEKRKAFLPFFSTKEKGTGLGLALVQKAMVGMGGKVEVESELGSGSTFHLYLPLIPAGEGGESG
ncbi:MAG: ATP-binding protein [candidate division NC10 bacterium]|nr:ATP-binding protein [candidate division NC10 bacterium]